MRRQRMSPVEPVPTGGEHRGVVGFGGDKRQPEQLAGLEVRQSEAERAEGHRESLIQAQPPLLKLAVWA
jgi:hypothetical protein